MTHGLVLCAAATPLLGFLQPLLLYKHSAQHRHNKQKPVLDMNTELSDRVAFNSKGSFESKYVFRMLDEILVKSWRVHQAVFDVAPSMATFEEPPSLAQVRRKLHCAETIEDYVWNTSMASLAELASLKRSILAIPNLRDDSPACAVFKQQFQKYKENNVWPMRRGALEKFIKDPFLKRLRTASFPGCEHKSGHVHELPEKITHGPSQDAQFQDEEEQPEKDELVGEDQEDEQEGDNTDEQDIEEEEIEKQYYDDVHFLAVIDSLEDSTGEEEED
ncbi:hypothetical protein IV203_016602 [Nitzschia inconspicua]|uniref:Uncharacterized protein n=1 Tax=Nitzschia inconspicua TaxID=303405 RepID=A0A9K3KQ73_9STRA|nr:hypothetical protein IV203_016602 [Nitzschia inconspicua]